LIAVDSPFRDLTVSVIAFGGPIATAVSGLFGFASAIVTVGEAIGFALLGGLGLVVLALAAVGVAIYLAIDNYDALGTAFVIVTDQIGMALKGVWDWITQYWPLLAGVLLGPFGVAAAVIATNLFGIRSMIVDWVSGAAKWLYEGGQSIIQGLINGIKDRVGDAVDAVKGAGRSIINGARDVLGWHSPSTVFMEAGKAIAEGLALGINRNASMAQLALNNLAGSVIAPAIAVQPALGGGHGTGGGTTVGDTIVSIGQINDKSDADYILNHMDRNQDLELNGISPMKGN
jgi:hypothetical protein